MDSREVVGSQHIGDSVVAGIRCCNHKRPPGSGAGKGLGCSIAENNLDIAAGTLLGLGIHHVVDRMNCCHEIEALVHGVNCIQNKLHRKHTQTSLTSWSGIVVLMSHIGVLDSRI